MTQVLAGSRGRSIAIALMCLALLGFVGLGDGAVATAMSRSSLGIVHFGVVVSLFGLSGYMLVLAAAVVIGAGLGQHYGGREAFGVRLGLLAERAAFFFVAVALSGILAQVIKHIVGRARPKLMLEGGAYDFAPLSAKASLASFPSGHATTVFAAALALGFFAPRLRPVLFAVALVICLARVLAHAHYPSDVLAGAMLGTAVTLWMARVFADRNIAFSRAGSSILPKTGRQPAVTGSGRASAVA